jgi:hypothetical protein
MNCPFCQEKLSKLSGWDVCQNCNKNHDIRTFFVFSKIYEMEVWTELGRFTLIWRPLERLNYDFHFFIRLDGELILKLKYHPTNITPSNVRQRLSTLLNLMSFT